MDEFTVMEQRLTLPISGMTCANCAMNIERNIKKLDGILEVNVNFASEQARVVFDPQKVDYSGIVQQIHQLGFKVRTVKTELPIIGMSCVNCAQTIEKGMSGLNGVVSARVNFAAEKLTIEYLPEFVTETELVAKVSGLGYRILP